MEKDNSEIQILNKKTSNLKHLLYGFLLSILMAIIYSFDSFNVLPTSFWIARMLGVAVPIFIVSCLGFLFRKRLVFYILIIALGLLGMYGKTL
tara:strand:+ start:141 stop:419 length:279 start_codon:yes stop_codon:yes gene_type:complete